MQRIIIFVLALSAGVFGAWYANSHQLQSSASGRNVIYATDLAGEPVDVSATRGKPKLINFWASWCKPCVVELPLLEEFAATHADEIEVLAVAIDTLPHVNDFLAKHPLDLPIAVGTTMASELMIEWGNDKSALPFSAMLDADGKLLRAHTGPFDAASLKHFTLNAQDDS